MTTELQTLDIAQRRIEIWDTASNVVPVETCYASDFIDANPDLESAVLALGVGESFTEGGGASPLFTIRREV